MNRTLYSYFVIVFLLLSIPALLFLRSFREMKEYDDWVERSHRNLFLWEQLSKHVRSAEVLPPSFAALRDNRFYNIYKDDFARLPADLKMLRLLVVDSLQVAR